MTTLASRARRSMGGFTLIEILVVIGIIAILAAIVIVAVNPSRQFGQANDTQRTSDVSSILNAIGQNIADNKGTIGGGCAALPTASTTISTSGVGTTWNASCLTPTYISAIPLDPKGGTADDTGYRIIQDSTTKRVTVWANSPQVAASISLTR